MRTNLTEPCKECPFRRKSMPGWLGPWEPSEMLKAIRVAPFPCHRTIKEEMSFDDPRTKSMELCAGAALFLNNKPEKSRCVETAEYQAMLGKSDAVFASDSELVSHHGNAPVKSWEFLR